jgi:hypothetical protein
MDEPQLKPCWVPPWFKLKVIPLVEGKALRMIVFTLSLLNPKPLYPKNLQVSLSAPQPRNDVS